MDNLELMREASRRGLLTPEQQALYDEAERRGLVKNTVRGETGKLLGTTRSALQGMTLGWADEIGAAVAATLASGGRVWSPEWSEAYNDIHDTLEMQRSEFKEQNPKLAIGAELAGGVAAGGAAGARLAGTRAAQAVGAKLPGYARAAGIAGGEGAVAGAGYSDRGERGRGAATGAAIGAVAGPAINLGVRGVAATGRGIKRVLGDSPDAAARRVIGGALAADDIGKANIADELRKIGPNASIADLGPNSLGIGRVAANNFGPGRKTAVDALTARQQGAGKRLIRAAGEAMDSPDDFVAYLDDISKQRFAQASPLYRQAHAVEADPSWAVESMKLGDILARPSMKRALRQAEILAADEGEDIASRSAAGAYSVKHLDYAKRALDNRIGVALRRGESETFRSLLKLKGDLLKVLDANVPSYGKARNIWSNLSAQENAAELGRTILKGTNLTSTDVDRFLKSMGADEIHAFRVGVLRAIADVIEGAGDDLDKAKKLVGSERMRKILRRAFGSDKKFEEFISTATAEMQMKATYNAVATGSRTAPMGFDNAAVEEMASPVRQAMNKDAIGLLATFLKKMGFGKVSDQTYARIAEIMFKQGITPQMAKRFVIAPQTFATPVGSAGLAAASGGAAAVGAGNYIGGQ